jgi:hypothetical protein
MDYAATVYPDHWRLGRRRLQPLSLGHALLLQRLGLDTLRPLEQDPGAGTLALFLAVLSRPWRRAAALVDSWRGRWVIRWLALRFIPLATRLVTSILLGRYLAAAWRGPRVWTKDTTAPTQDDPLRVLTCTLTQRLGYTHADALDLTLERALWEVCSYLAAEGHLEFYDSDDARLAALARAEGLRPATS